VLEGCLWGGRTFIRNLINLIAKLKKATHHVRLSVAARADIAWWVKGLDLFHGTTCFHCDNPLPSHIFSTDACLVGGGGHFGNEWFYVNWLEDMPEIKGQHINVLELQTVLLAAELWGGSWGKQHILVHSDNMATVTALNKRTSRSPELLGIVQQIFWLSVKYGFRLTAAHIAGRLNIMSDLISRMHVVDAAIKAHVLLCSFDCSDGKLECNGRMTESTFLLLQDLWAVR
jgi:hypothetical protein